MAGMNSQVHFSIKTESLSKIKSKAKALKITVSEYFRVSAEKSQIDEIDILIKELRGILIRLK